MASAARHHPHKAYMESLDYLRKMVRLIEQQLDKICLEFYEGETKDDSKFLAYLKQCNSELLTANNCLLNKNVSLAVVDGEVRIVSLLNALRKSTAAHEIVDFLTDFWNRLRTASEAIKILCSKFEKTVLKGLKLSFAFGSGINESNTETELSDSTNSNFGDQQLDISANFSRTISGYLRKIEKSLSDIYALLQSFTGRIHQELYENVNVEPEKTTEGGDDADVDVGDHHQDTTTNSIDDALSERILVCCDQKAFPVIRFVPDLCTKIRIICAVSRKWINRDGEYLREINKNIRETRTITRRREEDLRNVLERHKRASKAARGANLVLQNNKDKLQKIENELKVLDSQVYATKEIRKYKSDEKIQKESMVEFLKLTQSQTRHKFSIQLKRSRLLRQVRDLEESLKEMEQTLSRILTEIGEKHQERSALEERVVTNAKSYNSVRSELDKLSTNVSKLEREVKNLTTQLCQLEIIQMVKTSPENVEEVYERPISVHLAPSLREKIRLKRRLMEQKQTQKCQDR